MFCFIYFTQFLNSVSHAHSWSYLKPHMLQIIQEILFPIMQYSEEDEDLYQNDTIEYIRRKFDIYDDYSTPVPAAQVLFLSCCKIRKGILPQAIGFLNSVSINSKCFLLFRNHIFFSETDNFY